MIFLICALEIICFCNLQTYDLDAMSSQFEVRYFLSRGGAMVIGILRTMCRVITDVTANHRPSSQTVRVLPVRQFAVRGSLITHTPLRARFQTGVINQLYLLLKERSRYDLRNFFNSRIEALRA